MRLLRVIGRIGNEESQPVIHAVEADELHELGAVFELGR